MDETLMKRLRAITPEEEEYRGGKKEINKEIYMDSASMVVDSKKLLNSGKLIQIRTHTRFVYFPKHTHNYVEMIYMVNGQTIHKINNDKVILKKGELLFLNQHATQEIDAAGENDIAVNFIILPEFFSQVLVMLGEEESPIHDFIIGCLKSKDTSVGYLHFKVSDILPIQNLVENLIWTITNEEESRRHVTQCTMGVLFLQLLNYADRITAGASHPEEDLMFRVLHYIEDHYKDGELSALANELHYDLFWLSRMIKKTTGKTYTELIQTRRLNQASFLLLNTSMPVSDVGYAVGYDNLSYFHRIFKDRFGASPKQYRNNNGHK